MRAIREVLGHGGVVAGTSAGLAAQQAAPMVSGGSSSEAWLHGATSGYADDDRLRYIPAGGLGLFDEGLLDSHFNEWGRVTRAIRLAGDTNEHLAIGVDEHTALVYSMRDRTGEIIGTGGVSILDIAEATFAKGANGPGVLNVRWHHFTAGDRYNFSTGETRRATATHVAPGTGTAPETAPDVWGEGRGLALLHLAQHLLASPERLATGETNAASGTPRFRISLYRDERTTWTRPGGFADLRLSITPLPSTC
jgi:cyanophycinase